MPHRPTRRDLAVTRALDRILGIVETRDRFQLLRTIVRRYEPLGVDAAQFRREVPKWVAEVFVVLAKLYDQGYAAHSKDAEDLR